MLAAMFVYGGLDALRHPATKVPSASTVAPGLADKMGLKADTAELVRLNGAVQLAAGVALALGIVPRVASLALAASLVPTTAAGHRFWEETEPTKKRQQTIHFLKNVAMLGGLLTAAGDTGSRPSVPWRAAHATTHAIHQVREALPTST